MPRIILASASPRRREILQQAGLTFEVVPAAYEEDNSLKLSPRELVSHLALGKAREVAARNPDALVIGADTLVFIGAQVLGKPTNADDVRRMISLLSGQTHSVATAVAVIAGGTEQTEVSETLVTFRALTPREIDHYAALPNVYDLAGAYAVQGTAALFTTRIEGDYLGVVGLPLSVLEPMLARHGIALL